MDKCLRMHAWRTRVYKHIYVAASLFLLMGAKMVRCEHIPYVFHMSDRARFLSGRAPRGINHTVQTEIHSNSRALSHTQRDTHVRIRVYVSGA